jgi:hypothetical protein
MEQTRRLTRPHGRRAATRIGAGALPQRWGRAAGCCAMVLLGAWWAGCARESDKRFHPLVDVRAEREPWRFSDRDGTRIRTEHYDVYTTIRNADLLAALPQAIETACAYYQFLVPPARMPAEPMRVYLFATREEFDAFTREFGGAKAPLLLKVRAGGYSERGVSVIEYVSHEGAFPVLVHEGFHQYLYHCVRRNVPAWLNEGLAVLCEGQRWSHRGIVEFDAWFNPRRHNDLVQALQRRRTVPLRELLRMNAAHVVGGAYHTINTYYAQVWGLMLFLREGENGKYAADFERLLRSLRDEDLEAYMAAAHVASDSADLNPGQALFEAFISKDVARVEDEYLAFLRHHILGSQ